MGDKLLYLPVTLSNLICSYLTVYGQTIFVTTDLIAMSYLNKHSAIHSDVNMAFNVVWIVHIDMQAKVDEVVRSCWARECGGVLIVCTACVSHHSRELNGVAADKCLRACCVSRESNNICKNVGDICNVKSSTCMYSLIKTGALQSKSPSSIMVEILGRYIEKYHINVHQYVTNMTIDLLSPFEHRTRPNVGPIWISNMF